MMLTFDAYLVLLLLTSISELMLWDRELLVIESWCVTCFGCAACQETALPVCCRFLSRFCF